MPNPFTLSRSRCDALSQDELQKEIQAHTGNDSETDSILRSLERFGQDASIRSYEIIPRPRQRTASGGPDSTWTVRALREE